MKTITTNKKAFFDYDILERVEAGIVLRGDEVKSIRAKQISLNESFATVTKNELFLLNCFIAPYAHAYSKQDMSRQTRKLLLKRKEINKLIGAIARKGLTLIPLKAYFNERGKVKIELGLAKHRKSQDKRSLLKERDLARETARELRGRA